MKNVFGIKQSTYKDNIIMVCDNYNDALKIAAGFKDYDDDKAKELVVKLPYLASIPDKIDFSDLDTVVNIAVKATSAGFNSASEKEQA